MPRYVAFLRGVSPMNASMAELKRCFERAGFADVKTVVSSGNVVFAARTASEASLVRKAEKGSSKGSALRLVASLATLASAVRAILVNGGSSQ